MVVVAGTSVTYAAVLHQRDRLMTCLGLLTCGVKDNPATFEWIHWILREVRCPADQIAGWGAAVDELWVLEGGLEDRSLTFCTLC